MAKRILFITQDLKVGGGTSSLSSLYTKIKDVYDINVLVLTRDGNAKVTYQDKLIYPSFFIQHYYSDFSNNKGVTKLCIGAIKLLAKCLDIFGVNFERILVSSSKGLFSKKDYIISFGEGVATTFTQYIENKPKAAWIHYEVSKNPYSEALNHLYSKFDKIVCVSDIIAEGFGKIYPKLAQKTIGIHNIIDYERILKKSKESISEPFANDVYNIISLGRLSYVKRFQEIPRIASEIKTLGLKIQWRILGPECDDSEKTGLLQNIKKYNVADCVVWFGNRTNPYPYIAKSDLFVMLSTTEACPMVITEARILNVPIITTDFTTSYEFIDNNVDGIICPLDRVTENIAHVLSDKELSASLKIHSRKRYRSNETAINRFMKMIAYETE